METKLGKIVVSLAAVAILSLGFGRYFDARCEMGCLMAAGKEVAKKNGGNFQIVFDDNDPDFDSGHDDGHGPFINGPKDLALPTLTKLEDFSIQSVATEVTVRSAPKLAVRAYGYRSDKDWKIVGSGESLRIEFQEKGPDRLEIDLPPDFKGRFRLATVSGNVEVPTGLTFRGLTVQSVSGDVLLESWPSEELSVTTVSGDVTVRKPGEVPPQRIELKGVSADFDLEVASQIKEFRGKTVSGDMRVKFIGAKPSFDYRMHSISGDFDGIPGGVLEEGIANREMKGKLGEPKDSRLEFESISGDFKMTL